MPVCDKCNSQFPNRTKIDGVIRMLNKRRFCLKCSPFGSRNRRDLTKTAGNFDSATDCKVCSLCSKEKHSSEFYITKAGVSKSCCKKCFSEKYSKTKRERVARFRKKMKKRCIDYKGGSCQLCSYNKFDSAMDFHHLDPSQKDFTISGKITTLTNFGNIRPELDKCVLLCCRCHREIHEDPSLISKIGASKRNRTATD